MSGEEGLVGAGGEPHSVPGKRGVPYIAVLEQRGSRQSRRRALGDRRKSSPGHPHPNPPPSRGRAGRFSIARADLCDEPRNHDTGALRYRSVARGRLMQNSIAAARQSYAEELRFTANVRSRAVIAAFAAVPRERFVGSELWRVKSPLNIAEYWTTDDADPRAVYHDVLIALDEERGINNGQPSLWAFLFDRLGIAAGEHVLHLGCGTGYY